ncbi:MAG: ComF family protein [Rhodocyclaceae bacterium]|nr:MAG: ComF family protein [Rhodocyclaceae bacterium]
MQWAGIAPGRVLAQAAAMLGKMLPAQHCLLCQGHSGDTLLCPPCREELPPLPENHCPVCALPTPSGETCGQCLAAPPHYDRTIARWVYGFPVDRLIQALKYGHQLAVGQFLGDALLTGPSPDLSAGNTVLLPVPLSSGHLRQRGFNQAVEIARPIGRALQLPMVLDSCRRTRETAAQTSLPWKARQKNIRHAFECSIDLSGKDVILIDDVMTTGATLNELARTVKKHGALTVTNWVCARALKP